MIWTQDVAVFKPQALKNASSGLLTLWHFMQYIIVIVIVNWFGVFRNQLIRSLWRPAAAVMALE